MNNSKIIENIDNKLVFYNGSITEIGLGDDGRYYIAFNTNTGERYQITCSSTLLSYSYRDTSRSWHDLCNIYSSMYMTTETVSFSGNRMILSGILTSANKEIITSFTLPKIIPSGATITLNIFKANIRIPSGSYLGTKGTTIAYVNGGTDFLAGSKVKVQFVAGTNIATISITMATAFTIGNIPLGIELNAVDMIITV